MAEVRGWIACRGSVARRACRISLSKEPARPSAAQARRDSLEDSTTLRPVSLRNGRDGALRRSFRAATFHTSTSNAPPGVKPARESPKWPNSPHAVVPLLRGAGAAAGRELGDHASLMPKCRAENVGEEKCSGSPRLATPESRHCARLNCAAGGLERPPGASNRAKATEFRCPPAPPRCSRRHP
jgi:hypothetical protein